MTNKAYDLFGGAVALTLPDALVDIAELRQVPDTQEVFLEADSNVSYILEITQSVPVAIEQRREAIEYHYNALGEENRAAESGIRSVDEASWKQEKELYGPVLLVGQQAVAKFRRTNDQAELVDIFMALWRIPSKNAEIVLTINVPPAEGLNSRIAAEYEGVFRSAVASLRIKDYGLFAA